jgi:hypothetical protein
MTLNAGGKLANRWPVIRSGIGLENVVVPNRSLPFAGAFFAAEVYRNGRGGDERRRC